MYQHGEKDAIADGMVWRRSCNRIEETYLADGSGSSVNQRCSKASFAFIRGTGSYMKRRRIRSNADGAFRRDVNHERKLFRYLRVAMKGKVDAVSEESCGQDQDPVCIRV